MKVLVACEYSGRVRDAFIREGHDAVSCDLLPSETEGPHIIGDVSPILKMNWDIVVAHPPCTYLANSGVRWLHEDIGRFALMKHAADFFLECLNSNARFVAVENPVMHRYAREAIGNLRPNFTVQPWQFGDAFRKRTCFWTKNLPPLVPTSNATSEGSVAKVHLESPGPDRWKNRSRTYPGIADAIAKQWGSLTCRP